VIQPVIPVPMPTSQPRNLGLPWWADLLVIGGVLIATAIITTAIYWWLEGRP